MVMNNPGVNNQGFMGGGSNMMNNNNFMMGGQMGQMGQMYPQGNNMYVPPSMNYGYPNVQMPMYGMNVYNPMNYIYQPSYNPGMLMNQPPLNNYNRNILGNGVPQGQVAMGNQPIKVNHNVGDLSRLNNSRLDTDIKSKRAISSKPRGNNEGYSNVYNNMPYGQSAYNQGYYEQSYQNGPNTNPDSFSRKRNTTNNDGVYKPYTLKDYKEITSAKIVLGSLGANIGTKEWEEKQEKMKKMEEYNNNLKKNKMVFKFKKEDPTEIVEKEKKEKIEKSTRFKSYEYGKLVRPRSKIKLNDGDGSYLPSIHGHNESQHKLTHDTSGLIPRGRGNDDLSNLNSRYETYQPRDSPNIEQLSRKRDILKYQISEIKDSLLK
jgi:hypothetical protein